MRIFKLKIENYRLLRDFCIDVEEELTLVIGKNNTGKTSILSILEKFLSQSEKPRFSGDDFNIEFKRELEKKICSPEQADEKDFPIGIGLEISIEYGETDDLSNIRNVMMDLDPDNRVIILGFEYLLSYNNYQQMREDYQIVKNKRKQKKSKEKKRRANLESEADGDLQFNNFLQEEHSQYFQNGRKSFTYISDTKLVDKANCIDLMKEGISTKEIVNFKCINAKRNVANKELDKTLSIQTSRIYKCTEEDDKKNDFVEKFKETLKETDSQLSKNYKSLFEQALNKVRLFGGVKNNDSMIEIISSLQHRELLEGNTTVIYRHDENYSLPEHHNGLGYMNLISMIFEIEILVHEFRRKKDEKPADINLLFIEEPEAHTHPQMQYIFIKNIKKLLAEGITREDGENRRLQYIITTHSPCITADSDFDDIKLLVKESLNNVVARNLRNLSSEYEETTPQYQFLKQYLTVSRAEIFFADKAILIEGDTERILLPTFMRKIDLMLKEDNSSLPLLSQNISIIEVGAHSQIFEKFICFLGIKTLIITDLDSTKEVESVKSDPKKKKGNVNSISRVACRVEEGTYSANAALAYFLDTEPQQLSILRGYGFSRKILKKEHDSWISSQDGQLCVVYQIEEDGYCARSFEDAFIHINKDFIKSHIEEFRGIKNRHHFDDGANDSYALASDCINKKTHFALDILYNSNDNLSNWRMPKYIEEGLLWLKQD